MIHLHCTQLYVSDTVANYSKGSVCNRFRGSLTTRVYVPNYKTVYTLIQVQSNQVAQSKCRDPFYANMLIQIIITFINIANYVNSVM